MKFGIILSGCGFLDGSEIYESVMTMYFLEKHRVQYQCYAPGTGKIEAINHLTQEVSGNEMDVLLESARLARGNILPLDEINMDELNGLILPGGFGAIKNLCTFATHGPKMEMNPELEAVITETHSKSKVIAGMCISPVLIAFALRRSVSKIRMTVGNVDEIGKVLNGYGVETVYADSSETVVDRENKIITTPAYMSGESILDVSLGIEKMVLELSEFS